MAQINYTDVVRDLKMRAATLVALAEGIAESIGSEQSKASPAPPSALVPVAPVKRVKKLKPERGPVTVEEREAPVVKAESLADVIRRVAAEDTERTSTEIADRVATIRPDAIGNSVTTVIGQLIRNGDLHKTDQLKVRPVLNGRIQFGHQNGAHA